jgi:hypothetical protein
VHGTVLAIGACVFVAQVLAGRFAAVGVFSFLNEDPRATQGFLEGFGLAAVIGLMLREASGLRDTTRWNLLAALTHVILAVVNVTQWSFFVGLGATVPGGIATAAHVALAALELVMARRSRTAAAP